MAANLAAMITPCPDKTNNFVDGTEFNSPDILAALNKLKRNLTCGADGLPPLLFKCLQLRNDLTWLQICRHWLTFYCSKKT